MYMIDLIHSAVLFLLHHLSGIVLNTFFLYVLSFQLL